LVAYWGFLAFAIVLILIPGPYFAVVIKNTLAGGRRRGRFTAAGVGTSNAVQGSHAALSLLYLMAVSTGLPPAGRRARLITPGLPD